MADDTRAVPPPIRDLGTARHRTRSETHDDISAVRETLAAIQITLKHVEESTKANAQALGELNKPKDRTLSIIGMIISIAFPIGFIIFAAGEYPKRAHFETLESKIEQRDDAQRSDIDALEKEAIRLRGIIESLSKDVAVQQNRLDSLNRTGSTRRTAPSSSR